MTDRRTAWYAVEGCTYRLQDRLVGALMPRLSTAYQAVLRSVIHSKRLNSVSWAGEALYYRLLCASDGAGRMSGDAFTICAQVCTERMRNGQVDPQQVDALLVELEQANLVRRYRVEEELYLELVGYFDAGNKQKVSTPAPPDLPPQPPLGDSHPPLGDEPESIKTSHPPDRRSEIGDQQQQHVREGMADADPASTAEPPAEVLAAAAEPSAEPESQAAPDPPPPEERKASKPGQGSALWTQELSSRLAASAAPKVIPRLELLVEDHGIDPTRRWLRALVARWAARSGAQTGLLVSMLTQDPFVDPEPPRVQAERPAWKDEPAPEPLPYPPSLLARLAMDDRKAHGDLLGLDPGAVAEALRARYPNDDAWSVVGEPAA